MARVLLDASFLLARFNKRDVHHKRALEISHALSGYEQYMHEHVLDEVVGVIQRKFGKEHAIGTGTVLLQSRINILLSEAGDMMDAWNHFIDENELSYTDAHIASEMSTGAYEAVVTFDKEFEKLGVSVIS